ncbi:Gfo/Idh/MocA family oxidoreductase [Paenibacillus sp. HB172176]|uniref:Gfo/Idh/MocA family protein n=1 Tax=Paenibacillus sp. HB172176 TaxID=2493690 RepID=UPI00143B8ECE|nr:Gfo/Idh/MocA family oxidoreductase [Paenibacillus sp. HB172176]
MKIAIIGLGFISLTEFFPALMKLEDMEIVCAVDPNQDRLQGAARKYNIPRLFSSFEEMVEVDIDAALVLTPYKATYGIVRALLERGIDVFSEKPMAETMEQAEELVRLADEKNAIYMIGLNRRFADSFLRAKELMPIAKTELVSVEKVKHMTYYHDKPMLDFGIHSLDVLLWLCEGRVTSCSVDCTRMPDGRESSVQVQLGFDNGVKGQFLMSCCAGLWEESVRMFGHARTVEIQAPDVLKVKEDGQVIETVFGMAGPGGGSNSFGFRQELEHFSECVRTRAQPLTSGKVALYTQQVMDMIYKQM